MSAIAQRIGKRLATTRSSGGGNFINPGKGILCVGAIKAGTKPDFYNGDTAVGEFVVVENEGFTGVLDESGKAKASGNALGSAVAVVHQLEEQPDTAWPNLLSMLQGILGSDATPEGIEASAAAYRKETGKTAAEWTSEDEFGKLFDHITGKDNPLRGMIVGYSTFEKETKKTKKKITLIKWEPIDDTQENVDRRRAQLDKGEKPTR